MKYLFIGIIMIGLTSFSTIKTDEKYIKRTTIINSQQDPGEKLIAKLDCVGCHKIDKKLIGPSYLDIANKYPASEKNITYLSDKIIKGGSGVWGAIPMAPHSSLKKEDAKSIVKYILSLKK